MCAKARACYCRASVTTRSPIPRQHDPPQRSCQDLLAKLCEQHPARGGWVYACWPRANVAWRHGKARVAARTKRHGAPQHASHCESLRTVLWQARDVRTKFLAALHDWGPDGPKLVIPSPPAPAGHLLLDPFATF